MRFSAPRWAPTIWLLQPREAVEDIPADIRSTLTSSLYASLPIYAAGVVNTLMVAALATWHHPTLPFFIWLALDVMVSAARLAVLLHDLRAARQGRTTFTDLYLMLTLLWTADLGYGTFIAMTSGDWMVAMLVCSSTTAMIGGVCFRNFAAPRLVGSMIGLSLIPWMLGALFSREPLLMILVFQIPGYLVTMTATAFKLNHMLLTTMRAERDHQHRADHDPLTGLANRAGLEQAFDIRRTNGGQALFYCDLNGFKPINDKHGHAAGDQLLVGVAGRLKALDWPGLFTARVGGDEFVLLAPVLDEAAAEQLRAMLIAAIANDPYLVGDVRVTIGVSIGVAFARRTRDNLGTLMDRADQALYAHKLAGREQEWRAVWAPEI
jgi:diguanylate cyclase (GGDEF)-like protein